MEKQQIVGMDAGGNEVKFVTATGFYSFDSVLSNWRYRHSDSIVGTDHIEFEYQNEKFFAGTLARKEGQFYLQPQSDKKSNKYAILRVLIALSQLEATSFNLVVSQPISSHIPTEKKAIQTALIGSHEVVINGRKKTITVVNCNVTPEAATSHFSIGREGDYRIIDVGSGTVNVAYISDGDFIERDSFTIPFGASTTKGNILLDVREAILSKSDNWGNESIVIVGGMAREVKETLCDVFPYVSVHEPGGQHAKFSNAHGNYELARYLYE